MRFLLIPILILVFNLHFLWVLDIPLNAMVICVSIVGFLYGGLRSVLVGFYSGFLIDIFSTAPIGVSTLSLGIIGFLSTNLRRYLPLEYLFVRVGLILFFTLIEQIIRTGILYIYYEPVRFFPTRLLSSCLYTSMATIIVFKVMTRYEFED